jgi:protein-L-isoaspartate(D-aspartate) O-methyltransferase
MGNRTELTRQCLPRLSAAVNADNGIDLIGTVGCRATNWLLLDENHPLAFCRGVSHNASLQSGTSRMFDAAAARRHMVDGQVRTADVTNPSLIAGMQAVPRELFVPAAMADQAYSDGDLSLGQGRALLRPIVLGKLIQGTDLRPGDRVLDIGCGTGYSAAVLALMGAAVVALEEDVDLARRAESALADAGAGQVTVVRGPLTSGWPAGAPYDLILLDGAIEVAPEALGRQLKPDGRLAAIFGRGPAAKAMIYRPSEGRLVGRPIFDAAAPLLPGFAAPPAFVF